MGAVPAEVENYYVPWGRGQIPPRHLRVAVDPDDGFILSYDGSGYRDGDRDGVLNVIAHRARRRRFLRDGETWQSDSVDDDRRQAALDRITRDMDRSMAARAAAWLAMVASWARPLPLPPAPVELRPLVSQLVDVLDAGPAPPANHVVVELLAA